MCLMLYLGTRSDQPTFKTPDLGVEAVEDRAAGLRQWFSQPVVRLVIAHGTCSCGFPHFVAEEPVEYGDWLAPILAQSDDRAADLRSVRALVELIRPHVLDAGFVELYPVSHGSEHEAPKGTLVRSLDWLDPPRFYFTERFLYRVVS